MKVLYALFLRALGVGILLFMGWIVVLHYTGKEQTALSFFLVENSLAVTAAIVGFCLFLIHLGTLLGGGSKKSTDHGSAQWASRREVRRLCHLCGSGVVLGQMDSARYDKIPGKDLPRGLKKKAPLIQSDEGPHYLLVGPTGMGKGVTIIQPTLLSWRESVLVYDPKRENYDRTAGYRKGFSLIFRFEPTREGSLRWNPLREISNHPLKAIDDAQTIAEILCFVEGGARGENAYFDEAAKGLTLALILYVIYGDPQELRHPASLQGISSLLSDPERPFYKYDECDQLTADCTLVKMQNLRSGQGAGRIPEEILRIIRERATNIINMGNPKTIGGTVTTITKNFNPYASPVIAANTNSSDFSLEDLWAHKYPVSLYYVVSPNEQDKLKPLTRLLFAFAASLGQKHEMREKRYKKHRTLLLIDEFPSLGKMDKIFEGGLALWRSYGLQALLVTQSLSQLNRIYGEQNSLLANTRFKIFLGASDTKDADWIEKALGKKTILKKSLSRSSKPGSLGGRSQSISDSEMGRSLMDSSEIRTSPYEDSLLLVDGKNPIKTKKVFSFLDDRFKGKMNLPLPTPQEERRIHHLNKTFHLASRGEHPPEEVAHVVYHNWRLGLGELEKILQKIPPAPPEGLDKISLKDDNKDAREEPKEGPSQEIGEDPLPPEEAFTGPYARNRAELLAQRSQGR